MPTPNETDAATHRLQRIIVQEVSLVDRAANKRRFLMTKRDEPMTTAKKPVTKEDAAAATADVADQTAAAGDAGAGTSAGGSSMQQQVKEALTAALADAAEKIVAIANEVDKIEVTDQAVDPPVPPAIMTQVQDCAKALGEIAAKFGAVAPADGAAITAGEGSPAATAPAPNGDTAKADDEEEKKPPTDAEKAAVSDSEDEVAQKGLVVAKHGDLVTKSVAKRLGIQLDAAKVVVAKVGRRMAKKRLEQLGKAIDMLIGLMKELRYENEKRAKAAADASVTKAAAPSPKPEDVTALIANAESLVGIAKTQDTELKKAREALATANAKISQLEKTTGASNVIALEKSNGSEAGGSVAWPWDMNGRKTAARP